MNSRIFKFLFAFALAAALLAVPGAETLAARHRFVSIEDFIPSAQNDLSPASARPAGQSYAGILMETLDGKILKEAYSNYAFNPASNVKVATSYAVIKILGPDYRFATQVFADGTLNPQTGTLNGNLYISGRDPSFTYEHAVRLAESLNRLGISRVNGDLVVTDKFAMSLDASAQNSARNLFATLDAAKRSPAARAAWQQFLDASGKKTPAKSAPGVKFTGGVYVDVFPSNLTLLFSHESARMRDIVKLMMCYSNNFLAERLGDVIGGAYAVAQVVQTGAQNSAEEFYLQTSSGLGMNRVTPRAMMRLLRAFRAELARRRMTFADVMPVAGVDPGTLRGRFNSGAALGSVVGKTGTLDNTDAGASSLSGEMQTRRGPILFVIFNQRGATASFRAYQNSLVASVQNANGGAASLGYVPAVLAARLADTRINFAAARSSKDEDESTNERKR